MKSMLAMVGLGALLCLPCLALVGGGLAAAAVGSALVGFVRNPLVDLVGVLAIAIGVAIAARYIARRRACETDRNPATVTRADVDARAVR